MDNKYNPKPGKLFDENGHRIKRNPETTHRKRAVVNQVNPNVFRMNFLLDLEDAAKFKIFCRGKTFAATPVKGRRVRKTNRDMMPGDVLREYIHILVKNIELDSDGIAWVDKMRKKGKELRERQDAMIAAGINRIPKEEQLKRGAGAESFKKAKKGD